MSKAIPKVFCWMEIDFDILFVEEEKVYIDCGLCLEV